MTLKIIKGLFWKLLERFGVFGCQFILQLILARLLSPDQYGALAIMMIFITIANVFIQFGFNTSLIQSQSVNEKDYSSVLWVSLLIAAFFYLIFFWGAPYIANIYGMPELLDSLRVLALILFPGAVNAVQLAKVTKEMNFKAIFYSNLIAIVVSGTIGVLLAYKGYGLWALVVQNIINSVIICIIMRFTVQLKLYLFCDIKRVKILFSFGWKLVISSLLNSITENIRGLVIGLKYDSSMLGYYNRGMQFPQYAASVIQGTLQSVLLPAMSEEQNEKAIAKEIMKNVISLSSYIVFPLLAGLAGIATSFVDVMLTDKWLPCVPYMKVYCLIFAFYPFYVCNLQALNAMGRSDIYLKLEVIKQICGLLVLLIALFCFDTPFAVAVSSALLIPFSCLVNAYPNNKLVNYGIVEQIKDIMPSFCASVIMYFIVWSVELLGLNNVVTLLFQIIIGIASYCIISVVFRLKQFYIILGLLQKIMQRRHK